MPSAERAKVCLNESCHLKVWWIVQDSNTVLILLRFTKNWILCLKIPLHFLFWPTCHPPGAVYPPPLHLLSNGKICILMRIVDNWVCPLSSNLPKACVIRCQMSDLFPFVFLRGVCVSSKHFPQLLGLIKRHWKTACHSLIFLMFSLCLCTSQCDSGHLYMPTSLE